MPRDRVGHAGRKLLAIDGERRAGRHADAVGDAHDERSEAAHLFLEQADGVVELVAAERIAADELREMIGLVHGRRPCGAHFVERDGHAHGCRLPGRFRAGQSAANDSNHSDDHSGSKVRRVREVDGYFNALASPSHACR